MVLLTFVELQVRDLIAPSAGVVVKLIRVMCLATRYVCRARADLWDTTPRNKYMVAPEFGRRTGMPRARFDSLWTCLKFKKATGGGGRGSEEPGWGRVDVAAINAHLRAEIYRGRANCDAWVSRRGTFRARDATSW